MRLLDVEVDQVTEGGPALRDRGLRHHERPGQVEVTERPTERVFIRRRPGSGPSVRLESERTLKVVRADSGPTYQPVNPSVRHFISSELESPESEASPADLPEDRVVSSTANLQDRQAGRHGDKAQQSLLLSVRHTAVFCIVYINLNQGIFILSW